MKPYMLYSVGQKHFPITYADGPKFDLTENGFVLLIQYNRPTKAEEREIRNGKIEFRAVEVGGVLLFLAKFGEIPWMDMSFHRGLAQSKEVIRPKSGNGTLLHVMLVDSSSGILVAQKAIGLSNQFSHALADMIEAQSTEAPANWNDMVNHVYRRYTTQQLVDMAQTHN